MNANVNNDAKNEATQTLADMFAGAIIEDYSINGGTITLTLTDGDTIAIRHETCTYDILGETRAKKTGTGGGITLRARDAIDNGQEILTAWVEKPRHTRNPPITATTRKQPKPFRCTSCLTVTCAPRSSPATPHATVGKQNAPTSPSSAEAQASPPTAHASAHRFTARVRSEQTRTA